MHAAGGAGADGAGKTDQVSLRARGQGAAEQAGWLCPGAAGVMRQSHLMRCEMHFRGGLVPGCEFGASHEFELNWV